MMAPQASPDPVKMLSDLQAAHKDFRERYEKRVNELEAAVDERLTSASLRSLGGNGGPAQDPEYTEFFASFVRNGSGESDLRRCNAEGFRAQVNAALSVGSPSDGGYLAPTEWDREVRKALIEVSPMRRLATVMTTGVGAFSTVWNNGAWGTGWVGETAARPATSSATLESLEFASGEIYSNVPVTQRLLDDAQFDVQNWLAVENADEFARQEGIAFLSGNGVNKPYGFLVVSA
nr:phage major capsid protein [Novosphingobium panipatense]